MRNLFFNKISLISMLAALAFSLPSLGHSGHQLGGLWKTLTGKPTGAYKCEKGKKLIGLANESYSSIKLFFFFFNKKGKKATDRELDINQRANIKLGSGKIMLACVRGFEMVGVSTKPNKEGDESKFKSNCLSPKNKKANCFIKPVNNYVYSFKQASQVIGSGDFKSHSEPAKRGQLFKFHRFVIIKSGR